MEAKIEIFNRDCMEASSLAIACYNLGFDLTVFEIDKSCFDMAVKRFEEHKKQGRLFNPNEARTAAY